MATMKLSEYLEQIHAIIDERIKNAPDPEPYSCEICHDTGWIEWKDEDGHEFAKECKCQAARRITKRLEKSGLAGLAEKCTFDSYKAETQEQQIIKQMAARFLNEKDRWWYIGGQPGAGKTHICTAMCNELINRGKNVRYVGWRELKAEWNEKLNSEEGSSYVRELKQVPVLYIDDLLKGKPSEADLAKLFEIINYRYNNKLVTVMSSELYLDELTDLDEAVGSRIQHRCGDYIFDVNRDRSKNYRMKE